GMRENRRCNACEGGLEVLEAPRSSEQIAHNQECPSVAEHLERFGNWTGLVICFWHRPLFTPCMTHNRESTFFGTCGHGPARGVLPGLLSWAGSRASASLLLFPHARGGMRGL